MRRINNIKVIDNYNNMLNPKYLKSLINFLNYIQLIKFKKYQYHDIEYKTSEMLKLL
jgi:hypothetical protein